MKYRMDTKSDLSITEAIRSVGYWGCIIHSKTVKKPFLQDCCYRRQHTDIIHNHRYLQMLLLVPATTQGKELSQHLPQFIITTKSHLPARFMSVNEPNHTCVDVSTIITISSLLLYPYSSFLTSFLCLHTSLSSAARLSASQPSSFAKSCSI